MRLPVPAGHYGTARSGGTASGFHVLPFQEMANARPESRASPCPEAPTAGQLFTDTQEIADSPW